jgi:hypothetical protein
MPSDVRKACGLPASDRFGNLGYAQLTGTAQIKIMLDGSAERFRTSVGRAEPTAGFFGQGRVAQ